MGGPIMPMMSTVHTLARAALAALLLALLPSTGSAAPEALGDGGVIDQAMALRGAPFRTGGTTPREGFDCSGFIRYVYRRSTGIELPRTAKDMAGAGHRVARQDLRPGDLVFFNTLGQRFSHVGIYVDKGRFVHAPRRGKVVSVADMTEKYWTQRFTGARRVQGDVVSARAPANPAPHRPEPKPQANALDRQRGAMAGLDLSARRKEGAQQRADVERSGPPRAARQAYLVPHRQSDNAHRNYASAQPPVIYVLRSTRGDAHYYLSLDGLLRPMHRQWSGQVSSNEDDDKEMDD